MEKVEESYSSSEAQVSEQQSVKSGDESQKSENCPQDLDCEARSKTCEGSEQSTGDSEHSSKVCSQETRVSEEGDHDKPGLTDNIKLIHQSHNSDKNNDSSAVQDSSESSDGILSGESSRVSTSDTRPLNSNIECGSTNESSQSSITEMLNEKNVDSVSAEQKSKVREESKEELCSAEKDEVLSPNVEVHETIPLHKGSDDDSIVIQNTQSLQDNVCDTTHNSPEAAVMGTGGDRLFSASDESCAPSVSSDKDTAGTIGSQNDETNITSSESLPTEDQIHEDGSRASSPVGTDVSTNVSSKSSDKGTLNSTELQREETLPLCSVTISKESYEDKNDVPSSKLTNKLLKDDSVSRPVSIEAGISSSIEIERKEHPEKNNDLTPEVDLAEKEIQEPQEKLVDPVTGRIEKGEENKESVQPASIKSSDKPQKDSDQICGAEPLSSSSDRTAGRSDEVCESEVDLEDISNSHTSSEICRAQRGRELISEGEVTTDKVHHPQKEIVEVAEGDASTRDSVSLLDENCSSDRDDAVDFPLNQVTSSSNGMPCDDVNGDKHIQAMARADVDNVCNDDAVESATQNEEEDPFFSCSDKNKDTDMHPVSDDQERGNMSPMDVDLSEIDDQDKDTHSKISHHAGERGAAATSNDAVDASDDTSRSADDTANTVEDTGNTVPDTTIAAGDTSNTVDEASNEATNLADDVANEADDAVNTTDDTTSTPDDIILDSETITADKSSGGDEELCIVPDTEPRVPTDKEKADAVEKAAKASCSPSKEDTSSATSDMVAIPDAPKVNQNVSDSEKTTPKEENLPNTDDSDSIILPTTENEKCPQITKTSSIIQVVSTATLQNQSEQDAGKEKATDKNTSESTEEKTCCQCNKVMKCKYKIKDKENTYLCEDECYTLFRKKVQSGRSSPATTSVIRARKLDRSFLHKCGQCKQEVDTTHDKNLTWETMDFCNEDCLEKYQKTLGAQCANCKGPVQAASLGKYCVRFGYDMKQFCLASCLEDFKKGLKVCSYCQKDISAGSEGFLAPVGDKGQFKDFCSQICMEKYDQMSNNTAPPETMHECAVCDNVKVVKLEVVFDSKVHKLCSEPCFAAFKFVNAIVADQCDMCKKYFDKDKTDNFTVFYDDAPHSFCCKTCMNVYILAKRKIVPCTWCKVKKYNFDMIKRVMSSGQVLMMCSLHCMNLYQVSISAVSTKRTKCDKCGITTQAQYHLTMSDATIRNFCCYNCVMGFQAQYSKPPIPIPGSEKTPHPMGNPRRINARRSVPVSEKEASNASAMPVISSVTSLAASNGQPTAKPPPLPHPTSKPVADETLKTVYKRQIIVKPPSPPERQNRAVQVKPIMNTKGVTCRPHACAKETQTDETIGTPTLIPIPVPIYIPAPMHMFNSPYPVPIPFPLPIPVPIFIPTTRNSAKGIFQEIKRIQEKIPSDPFEAEMLMMAEMVAGEKKVDHNDTESEDDEVIAENDTANAAESEFSPEAVDTSNTFGEDMLQMALKIASELDEPAVDFEAAVVPTTIAQAAPQNEHEAEQNNDVTESEVDESETEVFTRSGRKRTLRSSSNSRVPQKRGRKSSGSDTSNVGSSVTSTTPGSATPSRREQTEKPDAHMCLKFTFGVNAWKHWVTQKNAELEKAAGGNRKLKLFKTDILQLTSEELNYSLCLFVKEVRKPSGAEYAPDTIFYLCLGIQQYLIENDRIENIFTDPFYEKFTECLDEVARKFTVLYNDSQFVVTRVEEEHLWESKQLGAQSPYVLLTTLMFFNTKYFNLTTVDEHMQLSFSHIMKHWKKHPSSASNTKTPGSRNVLLRFYPPQASLAGNSKKKKVYEQQENENSLRCPVKLYEFYLSKCPESVKTRNDVFYLLPERSCVPDSPVWYSTMALGRDQLQKMLHRIKMVKEINVALLSG